jgi:Kelch motif
MLLRRCWRRARDTVPTLLPDGKVLIAGGMRRNQDFYKSAELFDPATGKFKPTGEMNQKRVGHIAVLLASGKVLVAGGWVGQGGTDSAELYDPATGKFTPIAKMTIPRGRPSATLLTRGDVIIAGGEKQDNESLATADHYVSAYRCSHLPPHGNVAHGRASSRRGRVRGQGSLWRGTVRSEEWYLHRNRQHGLRAVQTYGRAPAGWESPGCGRFRFARLGPESEYDGDL